MKIALLGDIAFFGAYSLTNNPQIRDRLSVMEEYLSKFDIVVGNLETPFSVEKQKHGAKSAYICSDVCNADLLSYLHIGVVNLANNHMFDFGQEGFITTCKELDKRGIKHFGSNGETVQFNLDGNKLFFGGYCCYSSNPLNLSKESNRNCLNPYNVNDVIDIVKSKHDSLCILSVHAGLEHVNYPSIDHIKAARLIAESGQYVYYGHHPHVIQGVDIFNQSLIFHSLGNFCFDEIYENGSKVPKVKMTEQNRLGAIAELTIENNTVVDWKLSVIKIEPDGYLHLINDTNFISEFNDRISMSLDSSDTYNTFRRQLLADWLSKQKEKRNICWYIKHLSPRFVKLFIDVRHNKKEYRRNVLQYL